MAEHDYRWAVFGIALSFGLFAWLCVSMRIYVRFIYQRVACGIDDILLFIALIFYTALCGLAMHLAILHWGSPTLDIPSDNIPEITELWWIAQISYDITTMFIRLSIGVFLLRFLISRTHRLVVTWTVGIMCVFSIFYAFFTIFQCWPVAFFWTRWRGLSWKRGELPPGNSTTSATQVSKGYCFPYSYVPYASVAHSVVSGVSDWILTCIPILALRNIQQAPRIKYSIIAILSLGFLASIMIMIRIPYILEIRDTIQNAKATAIIGLLSIMEAMLGIMAASAIALRPLLRCLRSRKSNRSSLGESSDPDYEKYEFMDRLRMKRLSMLAHPIGVDGGGIFDGVDTRGNLELGLVTKIEGGVKEEADEEEENGEKGQPAVVPEVDKRASAQSKSSTGLGAKRKSREQGDRRTSWRDTWDTIRGKVRVSEIWEPDDARWESQDEGVAWKGAECDKR